MANNITINEGTAKIVGTDEVGSVHYQLVKLVDGTEDSEARIRGDATHGLDVDVTRVQGTVNVADGGGTLTVDGTVNAVQSGAWNVAVSDDAPSTFIATFDRIAPALNKYLATLWNGASGRKVCIHSITVWNWQESAVTGTVITGELRRITARTAGTPVTPNAMDTDDSLTTNITADTNTSGVSESTLLARFVATGEEMALGTAMFQNLLAVQGHVAYQRLPSTKPLTLRSGQGLTLKQTTNTTVGTVSVTIVFTDEPA